MREGTPSTPVAWPTSVEPLNGYVGTIFGVSRRDGGLRRVFGERQAAGGRRNGRRQATAGTAGGRRQAHFRHTSAGRQRRQERRQTHRQAGGGKNKTADVAAGDTSAAGTEGRQAAAAGDATL